MSKIKIKAKQYETTCINCQTIVKLNDGELWIDGWRCGKCSDLLEQQILITMPQPLGISVTERVITKDKMGG